MRYARLLEGLEVVERNFSDVATRERMDAECFDKAALTLAERLASMACIEKISQIANVSDGNHLSIANAFGYEADNVRYLRGQDINGAMMLDDRNPVFIPRSEYDKLSRSHIFTNDVLITIVGANTGQVALVDEATENLLTANCKLGIIRAKKSKIEPAYLYTFLAGRFGQSQVQSSKRGGGQMGLILPDLKDINVARFSKCFEQQVAKVSLLAHRTNRQQQEHLAAAEAALLHSLGLNNWQAPEPLSYTRSSRDAFAAGRLDAEHFQPKFQSLLNHLFSTGQAKTLGDMLLLNQRGKQPDYIESGVPVVNSKHIKKGEVRIDSDNRCAQTDEKTALIQPGDVVMNGTGVGTIGRAAPYLHDFGSVPDNHVTILRPKPGMDAIYLSVFINSLAGQMQVAQRLRGSSGQIELYPNDIARFVVWDSPAEVQANIRQLVTQSFEAKQRATQLLDAAKRAVEIAIEDSESAALDYLASLA